MVKKVNEAYDWPQIHVWSAWTIDFSTGWMDALGWFLTDFLKTRWSQINKSRRSTKYRWKILNKYYFMWMMGILIVTIPQNVNSRCQKLFQIGGRFKSCMYSSRPSMKVTKLNPNKYILCAIFQLWYFEKFQMF